MRYRLWISWMFNGHCLSHLKMNMTTRATHPWSAPASPWRGRCCWPCRCGGRSSPTPPSRSTARSGDDCLSCKCNLYQFHNWILDKLLLTKLNSSVNSINQLFTCVSPNNQIFTCVSPNALWLSADKASISLMS